MVGGSTRSPTMVRLKSAGGERLPRAARLRHMGWQAFQACSRIRNQRSGKPGQRSALSHMWRL
eukprot:3899110-Amphidinium_carterae.1